MRRKRLLRPDSGRQMFLRLLFGIPALSIGLFSGLGTLLVALGGNPDDKVGLAICYGTVSLPFLLCGIILLRPRRRPRSHSAVADDEDESGADGVELVDEEVESEQPATRFVTVDGNGHIDVRVRNAAEGKAAIKELRLLKKALALRKRLVTNQQQAIRAKYSDQVRRRGSKYIGGGLLGRLARIGQTFSRDHARRELANALQPLEAEKQRIQSAMDGVDRKMTEVQAFVLRCS
jgi:hypothetical protein